jgi:hypothetical protein
MHWPDLIQFILIGTVIAVPVLATVLRTLSLTVWIFAFGGLAIAASALHLYAMRIPLNEPEIWLGVLCGDVFPIAVASTLSRLLTPTTRPWVMGSATLASYIAALLLGVTVGGNFGAIYR